MTFTQFIEMIFTGNNLALAGAALAAIVAGMGSAKGVGMVGEASAGLLCEDPSLFGKALILQALPGTQGIYGLITAFVIILKLGLLGSAPVELTVGQGAFLLFASFPIAIVGYFSATKQARVAAAGINLIAKRPDELGKAITASALVETYAIFALLVSLLPVLFFKV
ncbi:MAG: V-type ATP synthase subunit K [Clostridia bacterium]|nr:V-type ATP synthase subunit K [Clostridia bacterium]